MSLWLKHKGVRNMRWVAPSEKDTANQTLEKRLWAAADQFRANSGLKAGQYSTPVLGLIFLRFAEVRFAQRGGRYAGTYHRQSVRQALGQQVMIDNLRRST
jgi:hypothetical protein